MIYKVHWIVDGVADIEAESKEDAEKKLQESLEEYVKSSKPLMNKFYAKSIQGTAYLPGNDENEEKNEEDKKKISLILIVIFFIPEIAISVGRKYEPEEGTFDRRKRIVIQPICRLVKETNIPGDVICEYQSQKEVTKREREFILVLLEILVKKKLLVRRSDEYEKRSKYLQKKSLDPFRTC